jgi:hypothetical protein
MGANELLRTCRPVLMLEANTPDQLREQEAFLAELAYRSEQPHGFMPWNNLFVPND